jgi:hypothetical protein
VICPTAQGKGLRHFNATGKSVEERKILSSAIGPGRSWISDQQRSACALWRWRDAPFATLVEEWRISEA